MWIVKTPLQTCNCFRLQPGLNKYLKIPFGVYVQVAKDNNPTNTNFTITLDAISLQPLNRKQGVNECMNIDTSHFIKEYSVTDILVTVLVIKSIEATVYEQEIKTLKSKEGKRFHCTRTIGFHYWIKIMTMAMKMVTKIKTKTKTKNIKMRINTTNMMIK